jgi:hypothetical protein
MKTAVSTPPGLNPFVNRRASDMFNTAMAFFATAGEFLKELPEGSQESWFTAARRAKLEVAVTNLALSIELLLKSLLLYTGHLPKKRTHDLLDLFELLPLEIRESIEREYKERNGESPHGRATTLELLFHPTDTIPADQQAAALRGKLNLGTSLRDVLRSERNAFVIWRYLSEQAQAGEITLVRVQYGRLGVIANSIQRHFKVINPPGASQT